MPLQEVQPRINIPYLDIHICHKPIRPLDEGDTVRRSMFDLTTDGFLAGTYPIVEIVVVGNGVNVTWVEGYPRNNKEYSLTGPEIKGDSIVRKMVRWSSK